MFEQVFDTRAARESRTAPGDPWRGDLDPVPPRVAVGWCGQEGKPGRAARPGRAREGAGGAAMRTYDDEVDVRGEPVPRQFLWRGRLYVVRDVVSHWYERSAWWDGAAARAARGDGEAPAACERAGAERAGDEREVWRVEASAGRSAGSGVFDLALVAPETASWRLLRVLD